MIRIRPLGLALAILFIVLGPQTWFLASNRASHTQAQPTPISSVLPDAASVPDQPTRGMIDQVQTKQGWMTRIESPRRMLGSVIVLAVVFAFYWPLRQKALARKQEQPNPVVQDSGDDDQADNGHGGLKSMNSPR